MKREKKISGEKYGEKERNGNFMAFVASIIIPAHNEEHVIAESLAPLLSGVDSQCLEVIVVCNGCNDKTAEIVRKASKKIICLETAVPSKTNALNMGDRVASGYPRFYLDADVLLPLRSIVEISNSLIENKWLAASPVMKMSYRGASWIVRSYYEVWQKLPYVKEGMIGTGVYALSREGRSRFGQFPDILADDGYIRALFNENERVSVRESCSIVRAPLTLKGLLSIKTRSRLGGYELAQKFPELMGNEKKEYKSALCKLFPHISLWPKMIVYLYVNLLARFLAKRRFETYGYSGWQRDDSSRKKIPYNN